MQVFSWQNIENQTITQGTQLWTQPSSTFTRSLIYENFPNGKRKTFSFELDLQAINTVVKRGIQ
jgi:hypothetical protein